MSPTADAVATTTADAVAATDATTNAATDATDATAGAAESAGDVVPTAATAESAGDVVPTAVAATAVAVAVITGESDRRPHQGRGGSDSSAEPEARSQNTRPSDGCDVTNPHNVP